MPGINEWREAGDKETNPGSFLVYKLYSNEDPVQQHTKDVPWTQQGVLQPVGTAAPQPHWWRAVGPGVALRLCSQSVSVRQTPGTPQPMN